MEFDNGQQLRLQSGRPATLFSIPVATVSECSSTSPHLDRSLLAALWRYWADYVILAMTDRESE